MNNISSPEEISTKPFSYDVSDLRALNRQVLRWWTFLPLGLVFVALMWFFVSIMLENGFDWMLLGILILIVAAASGPWTWRPLLMHRMLRRQGILVPQKYIIRPDYIGAHSERGDSHLKWTAVRRIKRSGERIFIFSGKSVAYVLPRRAFDSDEQFDEFAAAAQQCWERSHRL